LNRFEFVFLFVFFGRVIVRAYFFKQSMTLVVLHLVFAATVKPPFLDLFLLILLI
jgi:hypothetical protein